MSVHESLQPSTVRARPSSPVRRHDGERLPVVPVDDRPWVEVGVNWLVELCVVKSEKVAHVSGVVERHLAAAVIQVNAHPPGRFGGIYQAVLRVGARLVLAGAVAVVPLAQGPEAVLGAEADLLLPVDGGPGHAQAPGHLGAHLHLPVVSAGGVGLRAQHDVVEGEALRVVGQVGLDFPHLDAGAAGGNPQAGVSRGGVQGHGRDRCNSADNDKASDLFSLAGRIQTNR